MVDVAGQALLAPGVGFQPACGGLRAARLEGPADPLVLLPPGGDPPQVQLVPSEVVAVLTTPISISTSKNPSGSRMTGTGLLLLLSPWPGPVVSFLVLPYLANLVSFLTITDAVCERANLERGTR